MLENIRLAFRGIWSHKMRSFLTMLGIIIGIASIISIASTIQGTNEQIKQNLIGAGNNNVDVRLYQGESEYWMDNGLPDNISVISDEQKEQIRSLEGVANATFYNRRGYADGITYRNTSLDSGSVYGVDAEFLKTKGYVIQNGRDFVERDFKEFRKVVLLDDVAVQTLFPGDNPVGKTIELRGEPFTVVGCIRCSCQFHGFFYCLIFQVAASDSSVDSSVFSHYHISPCSSRNRTISFYNSNQNRICLLIPSIQ